MSDSEDEKPKLPLIKPMRGILTKTGLDVQEKALNEKPTSQDFIYFPSITYGNRGVDRRYNVNTLAYGTYDIIKLLVSGGVPPFIFQKEYWYAQQERLWEDSEFKYCPKIRRKRELWEPKLAGTTFNAQIDKDITEARLKQKKLLKKISMRADEVRLRTDDVLRKKTEKMDNRVKAFVEKMEKRAQKNGRKKFDKRQ
ncbi:uncharacterized protein LOC133193693 [Saccostrea echinata]|uniref:uncharacterized protein LOC133193693 n=1 Tax=Saccostrea echinata TaxID=191078 RepID=UPI002A823099|nr:uncharacterized protein LOC133193693 [Saccostrea echinata]